MAVPIFIILSILPISLSCSSKPLYRHNPHECSDHAHPGCLLSYQSDSNQGGTEQVGGSAKIVYALDSVLHKNIDF